MINCATIKAAVAAHYGIPLGALEGRSKLSVFAHPRQVAMALSRQLCTSRNYGEQTRPISFAQIGRRFHRDHSTVIFGIRQVELLRKSDPALRKSMRHLTIELLRGEE